MDNLFRLAGAALIVLAFVIGYWLDGLVNGTESHSVTLFECLLAFASVVSSVTGFILVVLGRPLVGRARRPTPRR